MKEILTEKEAAMYIGMSRSFLAQDRMNGFRENRTPGPAYTRLGGLTIRYLKRDLDEWINQYRVVRVMA